MYAIIIPKESDIFLQKTMKLRKYLSYKGYMLCLLIAKISSH